jgi:hypothetical protein
LLIQHGLLVHSIHQFKFKILFSWTMSRCNTHIVVVTFVPLPVVYQIRRADRTSLSVDDVS